MVTITLSTPAELDPSVDSKYATDDGLEYSLESQQPIGSSCTPLDYSSIGSFTCSLWRRFARIWTRRFVLPVPSPSKPSSNSHAAAGSSGTQPPNPFRQESDKLKRCKVNPDDPVWKTLPTALKKFKINGDEWQNYAMFICYGSPGNRFARCLNYAEKPCPLFQELEGAKKIPVLMLKHIKHIRSPIAVALQKQAARKASSDTAKSSGWLEFTLPAVDNKKRADDLVANVADASDVVEPSGSPPVLREIQPPTDVSYAVAVYPYMASQEDELDIAAWWVLQHDPTGSGIVELGTSKQGLVLAGCLLKTNVPVATAIAEATARGTSSGSLPQSPAGKTPILTLSISSTSLPGTALIDYKKKGEEELNLAKDDCLRVYKRCNHWFYAVKEETGDRGWVPSWFIGKVPTATGDP